MRTRNMSLSDYGVPKEDQDNLYKRCRSPDKEDEEILTECVKSSAPGLENFIYDSLSSGKSYDVISKKQYIPAKIDDFYAYRRKTAAEFYRILKLLGRW